MVVDRPSREEEGERSLDHPVESACFRREVVAETLLERETVPEPEAGKAMGLELQRQEEPVA